MELYEPMGNVTDTESTVNYAGFWPRFGAAILDGLIIGIPLTVINWTILDGLFMLPLILNTVVNWIYSASMESGPGMATLGKRALGLKVVNERGQRITFGQATGRYFGKNISFIILGIGYLMMIWDDRKQTLHDKMANTFVISK